MQVSDAGAGSGSVIAELYDATPNGTFTNATPRLVNVSVLKSIATGTSLTAGFYVGGTTSKTVLIRAIGPTLGLAPFNTARRIGAFAVANGTSRDAMLLITLEPGSYTANVSPAGTTAGGTAIVEVYEVP